ncbi:hypothetical protein IAT38_008220 [Cryptococcus sp. DSM 104549]
MKWTDRVRLLAIPTVTAFLSFIFVAIKPWGRIAGQWAFLVYTSTLIFFFPRGHIGPQIESTVLGIAGGTIGIAWTCGTLAVAAWCGRRYGPDSNEARAILGLGLGILCVIAGLVRSYARRFNTFSKIMLFFPIFLLTDQQDITRVQAAHFLEQFYVVLFSGLFALIPTLVLAPHHTPSHQFGVQVEESIRTTCALLPLSFSHLLGEDHSSPPDASASTTPKRLEGQLPIPPPSPTQDQLAKKLKDTVSSLHTSSVGYLKATRSIDNQIHALPAVVKALQHIVRNPLLGPTSHIPGERIQAALLKSVPQSRAGTPRQGAHLRRRRSLIGQEHSSSSSPSEADHPEDHHVYRFKPRHLTSYLRPSPSESNASLALSARPGLKDKSQEVVTAMVETLHAIERQLPEKFGWSVPMDLRREVVKPGGTGKTLAAAKEALEVELSSLQRRLGKLLGESDHATGEEGEAEDVMGVGLERTTSATPSRRTTFSETTDVRNVLRNRDRFRLAFYMTALLDLARDVHGLSAIVVAAPEQKKPATGWSSFLRLLWVNRHEHVQDTLEGQTEETDLVPEDDLPHDEVKEHQDMDFVTATFHQPRTTHFEEGGSRHRVRSAWRRVWDNHSVVRARISLSRFMHGIKHSRHVLFSIKLSTGIVLLSVPALMGPDNPARQWYDSSRGGWMVVSYMFVLEDTTGAILKVGFLRGLGTFIGAVMGYVCVLIAKGNPYGLVTLATACSVPISWNVLFASYPGLGTSTGITLPPLLFIPYLGLAHGQSDFTLAWNRFVDIIIGTAAAVLVGTWVWPVHARVQYFRAVSGTMEKITEYYLRMSRDLVRSSLVYRVDDKQYEHLEAKIKRDFQLSRTLISIQRQEISLLPRPIKLYSEIIDASERLLATLTEVRILRFSVPRKETVLDVLPIRRELISTILINLWSCGHAFGSRSPLPQFLPSPRVPLSELIEVTEEHTRHMKALHRHHNEIGAGVFGAGPSVSGIVVGGASGVRSANAESYQAELAVLYAMAENEALGEVCNILEEIVAAARTLFGTQGFLENI